MSLDIDVLRCLLRLTRQRKNPTLGVLAQRVGVDETQIRRALFSLARGGLVQRTPAGLRLSLEGLAVAVAVGKGATQRRAHEGVAGSRRPAASAPQVGSARQPLVSSRPRRRPRRAA